MPAVFLRNIPPLRRITLVPTLRTKLWITTCADCTFRATARSEQAAADALADHRDLLHWE